MNVCELVEPPKLSVLSSDGSPVNERRSNRRVLIRRSVDFSWEGGEASGWGRDIGPGGMYVQSDEHPAAGTSVKITVRFRRAPTVSIPARVCRTTGGGFAVHFDSLGQLELETILKVIGSP